MPVKPYTAEGLTDRLSQALSEFVLDDRRFSVDIEGMEVRIPPLLWACRDMIVAQYQRRYGAGQANLLTALAPHLSARARQRLENAIGYKIVPQAPRWELAVPKRRVYYPGKVGRIEP
mgnify:CR=1 FL=1